MTPIQGPTSSQASASSAASPTAPNAATPRPELEKATREFEAVFLRQLLAPMEKATHLGKATSSGGGDAYGSMVVGALADSISAAGGLGLAQVVAENLTRAELAANPAEGRPPDLISPIR